MDANFPREKYLEELPALVSLCEAITAKQYEVVFIDIRCPQHFNEPNIYGSVRHHLKRAGAGRVQRVRRRRARDGGDVRGAMGERGALKPCRVATRTTSSRCSPPWPRASPRRCWRAISSPRKLGARRAPTVLDATAQNRLRRILRHFATDNPYQRSDIPLLSDFRRDVVHYRVRVATEARNAERRKVEPLYLIDRDKPPLLIDEHIEYNRKPRDEAGPTWAAERLAGLGFDPVEEERVIAYRRELSGLELYADPRQTKALFFLAYAPKPPEPVKKRRAPAPTQPDPVDFQLPDSAKNDLPGQFLKAMRSAIKKRASYRKEYRKSPWHFRVPLKDW